MVSVVNQVQTVNLSAEELRSYGFSDNFINDLINLQINQFNIADNIDFNAGQITQNTTDIESNQAAIQTNATNIGTNASNISSNTTAINTLSGTVNTHIGSSSQHGVTGNNVGTQDYAQSAIGGVVLLADAVTNANQSSVSVTSPDASAAPAAYDQVQVQEIVDLANEMKGDVNQLVSDVNSAIDQLNDLLANMRLARQLDT